MALSDGTSKMRMIGLNSKQTTMMNEFSEKRETVILKDCQIQQARRGDTSYGSVVKKHNTNSSIAKSAYCDKFGI